MELESADMVRMLRWGRSSKEAPPPERLSVDRVLKTAPELPCTDEGPPPALAGLQRACETLDATAECLRRLRKHIHAMSQTAIAASTEDDLGSRALMAEEYEDHLATIPEIAPKDKDLAVCLVGETARGVRVPLDTGGDYAIAPFPISIGVHGLNLTAPRGAFALHREVAEILIALKATLDRLDNAYARYQRDRAFLTLRVQQLTSV